MGTPLIITNDIELEAALERAEALAGCTNDSEEERELAELEIAVFDYIRAVRGGAVVDQGATQRQRSVDAMSFRFRPPIAEQSAAAQRRAFAAQLRTFLRDEDRGAFLRGGPVRSS